MKNIFNKLFSICAWFFGVMFALTGFIAIFQEGLFTGLLMLTGGVLLLPPIKRILVNKTSKLTRGKVSLLGTFIIILSTFGISPPEQSVDINETPQTLNNETVKNESIVDTSEPPAIIPLKTGGIDSDNSNVTENPFGNTSTKSAVEKPKPAVEKPKPAVEKPKPVVEKPKPVVEKPKPAVEKPKPVVKNNCSGLPRTCGKMNNCKQAYQALQCGNRRLDRDNDGIPCESICL